MEVIENLNVLIKGITYVNSKTGFLLLRPVIIFQCLRSVLSH